MNTCSAIGCPVQTGYFMCMPHHRLLSKEIRDELTLAEYRGLTCVKAIEFVAERENKQISSSLYMKLKYKYEIVKS